MTFSCTPKPVEHRVADVCGRKPTNGQRRSSGHDVVYGQCPLLVAGKVDLSPDVRAARVDPVEGARVWVAVGGNARRVRSVELDQMSRDIGIQPSAKE